MTDAETRLVDFLDRADNLLARIQAKMDVKYPMSDAEFAVLRARAARVTLLLITHNWSLPDSPDS